MKKKIHLLMLAISMVIMLPFNSKAQSVADLLEQLSLDYQKLAGLKSVLQQMYQGYSVLSKGYNSVRDVSQGNFTLHEASLNGLLVVSPTVRDYPRVADIIRDQANLASEYKSAYQKFRYDRHFSPDELKYMLTVYNNLVAVSWKNINDLTMVVADNQLRMSDAGRLTLIDRIYKDSREQLTYLRRFNDQTAKLLAVRIQESNDQNSVKSLYGIK